MKAQRRLMWLVAVMAVLALVRVLAPPTKTESPPAVAEAVVRKLQPSARSGVAVATVRRAAVGPDVQQQGEIDVPGNAFGVRPPPPPPYIPPTVVAKGKPMPVVAMPLPAVAVVAAPEPPLSPSPYQVIGTWDDAQSPGVFLASPSGTMLARSGMTLQAEYKVSSITSQQILLTHVATGREIRLDLLRPPETLRPYP